jgi:hypothetical protein
LFRMVKYTSKDFRYGQIDSRVPRCPETRSKTVPKSGQKRVPANTPNLENTDIQANPLPKNGQKGGRKSTQKGGRKSTQKGGHKSTQKGGRKSTQKGGHKSTQKGGHKSTQKGGRKSRPGRSNIQPALLKSIYRERQRTVNGSMMDRERIDDGP